MNPVGAFLRGFLQTGFIILGVLFAVFFLRALFDPAVMDRGKHPPAPPEAARPPQPYEPVDGDEGESLLDDWLDDDTVLLPDDTDDEDAMRAAGKPNDPLRPG